MREQIEMLEYHSGFLSDPIDINMGLGYFISIYPYISRCGLFQKIDTPQESTFSGSGRTYHADDFTFLHIDRYPFEDLKISKAFV